MNKIYRQTLLAILVVVFSSVHVAMAQQLAPLPPRTDAEQTWTDHYWEGSDGTDFHYVEQGEGIPVILIHGLTSSAVGNWFNTGIGQKLATTNRVIALDMRGHGDTGPSPEGSDGTMINDVIDISSYSKQKDFFYKGMEGYRDAWKRSGQGRSCETSWDMCMRANN